MSAPNQSAPGSSPSPLLQRVRHVLRQTRQRQTTPRPGSPPFPPQGSQVPSAGQRSTPSSAPGPGQTSAPGSAPPLPQSLGQSSIEALEALEARLAQGVLRVAVFGLVSRGKSAVINALLGQPILPTGPLHGVTRWPRSVYWQLPIDPVHDVEDLPQVELIDTPGLDEIEGEARGSMAQEVAHQADLILFVVAGDITRTEYDALLALQSARKPLVLVFNKIDLYPDVDRQAIYDALTTLWREHAPQGTQEILSVDDIVMVAAAPAPVQVRVEWPDGRITYEWETPPPEIAPLKRALLTLVRRDGTTLIALNVLREVDGLETRFAQGTVTHHEADAEALIWRFAKYKALAVAFNPVMVLDLVGGMIADLAMIRALANLYGLPITNHETRRLWQAIARSSGTLFLSEVGTGLLMGTGKTAAAVWSLVDGVGGATALMATMAAQAGAAGYGTYAVGKAAQVYLEQGCTWGPQGIKTVMQDLLSRIDADSTVARMGQEIAADIAARSGGKGSPNSR